MNYLKEVGISDESFEEIRKVNGDGALANLYHRKDEASKIIIYLKGIHIMNVEDILKYVIDVFFEDYEDVKSKFEAYGLTKAVNEINTDLFLIENVVLD